MAVAALLLLGGTVSGQTDTARRPQRAQTQLPGRANGRPVGGGGRAGLARPAEQNNLPIARQVRQAFQNRVRQELNLDAPKMRRLVQTDQRFDVQRRELNQSEKQTRVSLAAVMQDSAGPDQGKVDQYLSQLVQAAHKRADLVDAEQKELSSFLTPMQRAQYLALKEQLNKRLQEVRQANGAGRGAPPPTQPPPPDR
jgi:hypothetical protein